MVQPVHHPQLLLESSLCPLPQGPWRQNTQQLPCLSLTGLQYRQVVGVSGEEGQELIEFPLEPLAGLIDGAAQGIGAAGVDQDIGIGAAGQLHNRNLQP